MSLIAFTFLAFFLSKPASAQFPDSLALFVVAEAAGPNTAEQAISDRLDNMGFIVEYVDDDNVTDGSADGMSLVLISGTVVSGNVAGNMPGLKDLAVPIINWEPALYDNLGFQNEGTGEFNTTEISIINSDHPLAAGLPDDIITITTAEKAVSFGTPLETLLLSPSMSVTKPRLCSLVTIRELQWHRTRAMPQHGAWAPSYSMMSPMR